MSLGRTKPKSTPLLIAIASFATLSNALTAAHAADQPFSKACAELATCAAAVGGLLHQKYVFDADFKGKVHAAPNFAISKDNAELLFTYVLHANGFSRVPLSEPGTYGIMRERDARDSALPTIVTDSGTIPEIPAHWDLMTLVVKVENPEIVEHIAKSLRNFISASSRIVASENSGTVIVTDSAANLKRLLPLIRQLDVKPSDALRAKWREDEVARRQAPPPSKP